MARTEDKIELSISPATSLQQDPHAIKKHGEKNLEIAIGKEVRALRKSQGITVVEMAKATGLSVGMLSKIENGLTSASLGTLQALAKALRVPITLFFRGYEEKRSAMFVKADEGVEIERVGTRSGHQYQLLGHIVNNSSGVTVEPYLIHLTEESDVFPTFQHNGTEFLYMLEGRVRYSHADDAFELTPGDSLIFDADAPHGPIELIELPAKFLSIISYPQNK